MAEPIVLLQAGARFGKLLAIRQEGQQGTNKLWLCRCDCGKECHVRASRLCHGRSTSCGCNRGSRRHGHAGRRKFTRAYSVWAGVIKRCNNPRCINFPAYGGRGISVCQRWLTFENFLADMGDPPSPAHEIDRYPNKNGNYEPGNCRWATHSENMRNTRRNHLLTFQGKTQCLTAWAEELGISARKLRDRILKLHWPLEKAFIP